MGFNQLSKERKIDIVFCIDATSSMGPCIDNVKKHARTFYQEFVDKMTKEYNSTVDSLRVQVIVFRDLECDTEGLVCSEFFELPADSRDFENYLDRVTPRGGGDYKESGLEAIYTAMTTKWIARGSNDRQVILFFSDADAIDFGEKENRTGYPKICDQTTFLNMWLCRMGNANKLSERCKRMVMFAPAKSVYEKLQGMLNRTAFKAVVPQKGMADVSFDEIMKILCASASSI